MSRCLTILDDHTIEVNPTLLDYKRIRKNTTAAEAIDLFFHALGHYSGSTEMVTTWLGRKPEHGGMVVIPWNILAKLVFCLLSDVEAARKPWYKRLCGFMMKINT